MFERLKRVLVKSFVGTVALGYLLAEIVQYFVAIFTTPIATWTIRSVYGGLLPGAARPSSEVFKASLSPLMGFFLLSTLWYILLRWLYFTPIKEEMAGPTSVQIS